MSNGLSTARPSGFWSVGSNLIAKLPDNVWAARVIVIVVIALLVTGVVQLVSCVAGAGQAAQSSESDAVESESQPAEAEAGTEAQAQTSVPMGRGSDTGLDDPWVLSGKFTTGDAELDEFVKGICDSNSTSSDPSVNALNAYKVVLGYDYEERDDNQYISNAGWDLDFAIQFMQSKGGNCFNNSAMMQWVCRYFGYDDATAVPIVVLMQSGNWSDHGAVFVTDIYHDGKPCVIDDALFEDGWMMDGDTYTYSVIDVGQTIDRNAFYVKNADDVVSPPQVWADARKRIESGESIEDSADSGEENENEESDESGDSEE